MGRDVETKRCVCCDRVRITAWFVQAGTTKTGKQCYRPACFDCKSKWASLSYVERKEVKEKRGREHAARQISKESRSAQKNCTKCRLDKPLTEFAALRGSVDGRRPDCKECGRLVRSWSPEVRRLAETADIRVAELFASNDLKRCTACQCIKKFTEFGVRISSRDGRSRWCRPCKTRYHHEYYEDNKEALLSYTKAYARAHPDVKKKSDGKRRAVKAAATIEPFTPADLRAHWEALDLWDCFYCGGSLTSASLEVEHFYPLSQRVDWQGSHALWNLVPSCPPCNRSKSDREPWTFLAASLAERGLNFDALTDATSVGK